MVDSKIHSFEDMVAWQEAQNLAVGIYKILETYPGTEVFGLTSQMKRAAASVSANIAEGFGRRTTKNKLQFYAVAYGSLLETKNFIYLSKRLGFIEETSETAILDQIVSCQKLLNALMRSLREA